VKTLLPKGRDLPNPPVTVNLMVTTRIANIRPEHTIGWALIFIAAISVNRHRLS